MAKYAQVEMSFWNDPDIRNLHPHQRYLYLWTFTNLRCGITGLYPLVEYENGLLTGVRKITPKPVEEYLKPQRRFRHIIGNPDELAKIQEIANNNIKRYNLIARSG